MGVPESEGLRTMNFKVRGQKMDVPAQELRETEKEREKRQFTPLSLFMFHSGPQWIG